MDADHIQKTKVTKDFVLEEGFEAPRIKGLSNTV